MRKPPPNKHNWTNEELSFITDNFYSLTNQQIADGLGMKLTSVRTKCIELGLKRMEMEYWTVVQIRFLRLYYKHIGDTELAEIFTAHWHKDKGWTKKHIEKKRRYLKLVRTASQKRNINRRNVEKGKFAICPIKAWETRGVAPVGIRKLWRMNEGYRMVIKLKDGWVNYSHWLWEQIYGTIPDGYVVRLKDDNPENVALDNMMMVSRAQHAKYSSDTLTDKYVLGRMSSNKELRDFIAANSPELIELKRLQLKLNRNINETANRKEAARHA